MADTKISELTEATSLSSDDEIPLASSGSTKRADISVLQNYLGLSFQETAPADVDVPAGEVVLYVDKTVSPITLNAKVRTTDSPEIVLTFAIA